jgi:hypothetical protein
MESWQNHYTRAVFLELGLGNEDELKGKAVEIANARHWKFETIHGTLDLIFRLLHGKWDDDFLEIKLGEIIKMGTGAEVVTSEPLSLKE